MRRSSTIWYASVRPVIARIMSPALSPEGGEVSVERPLAVVGQPLQFLEGGERDVRLGAAVVDVHVVDVVVDSVRVPVGHVAGVEFAEKHRVGRRPSIERRRRWTWSCSLRL